MTTKPPCESYRQPADADGEMSRPAALGVLLEREREQAGLDRLFDGAVAGTGGLVVFEGPAGIGKTRLLAAAVEGAQRRGMAVGRARGGSLEQDFAFGVVCQLLEPLIATGDPGWWMEGAAAAAAPVLRRVGEVDPAAAGSVLHGLYWVTAALAERQPLALILDDAHWFDGPSLRYVAYLTHRVEDLPIALVVATRPPEAGPGGDLLARVLAEHRMHSLHPAPLSVSAVAAIVRDVWDADADTKFCHAIAEATRGNPFLVEELMRSVSSVGLRTDASSAGQVGEVAAGSAVLARLGRLSSGARELARAASVLGGDAHLRHAAALGGLAIDAAELAADALLRAEILGPERPLTFVHPIVASAVYRDLLPGERSLLHRHAARLLTDEGESASRIAAHLLATEPTGDAGVVEVLRGAAHAAGAQGATDVAISYLRRALDEPPPVADRLAVVFELGANEAFVSDLGAVEHLGEVLPTIGDPDTRLLLGVGRAMALAVEGYAKEALAAVREIAESPAGDPVPSLEMLAATVLVAMTGPTAAALTTAEIDDLLRVELTDDTPAIVHGVRCFVGAFANENTDAMADTAARSLAMSPPDGAMLPVWYHLPITTLLMADRVADASAAIETAMVTGRRLGAPSHIGVSTFLRSWLALRQGELADAEADALASVEIHQMHGTDFLVPAPLSVLINVMLERDDLAGADVLLNRFGYAAGDGDCLFHLLLLRARGRLRGAQRRFDDWIADATRGRERYEDNAGIAPAFLPFDADLARAYAATGAMATATKHAQRALELAQASGAPRALGEGWGAVALVDPHAAVDAGEQAIEAFQRAGATLETAWMMHDLAISDRRRSGPDNATLLADSLELAERCGADRLASMARRSLRAIGGRPRRNAAVGAGALTPSERRVTALASVGRTNKDIAQELYVTVKTVETHLARAYQKLQITSRAELASALNN